ncbi:MAG: TrkH family potassium uptake protein [Eubacteriales bacterium]|nr:TrkH family potassium uptake protein [Eubacteriales bacterium]
MKIQLKGFFRSRTTVIACGFLALIMLGTGLLMLPVSAREGSAGFLDALFTAASATCVTGLVVRDTFSYWSRFGQVVILLLIQMGGLGVMTVATLMLMAAHRRIGLRQKELLSESMNAPHFGGITGVVKVFLAVTLCVELAGAALLSIRFCPELGAGEGLFVSLFTAVSAFCNGGFDLFGRWGEYCSLVRYAADPLVTLTVSALIIIGGLGFLVWNDLLSHRLRFARYSLHSKIVLVTTAALLAGGTLLFLLFERDATGAQFGPGGKMLTAFFSSVTARTAGFNSVDTAMLSAPSKLLTMILMFIGGSPGSTAGGVKTTTIFTLLVYAFSMTRLRRNAAVFGRRIEEEALEKAVAVVMLGLIAVLGVAMAIMALQPQLGFVDVLFECFSAAGTVGMTTGVTRALNSASRVLIVLCMYCGRLGSLTFAMALGEHALKTEVRVPQEQVIIG